ncbi:MAG: hypothetical protein CMK49_00440 [Prochlorococcus sp. SP3034]|nr:hypothetical protein [Prochlorococcus sp. SP3034]
MINTLLVTFLVYEVFQNRWNQLTEKEKKVLITLSSLKYKLKVFTNALKLTFQNIFQNSLKFKLFKNNITSKKWVRTENKNPERSEFNLSSKDFASTNTPKKDIIGDEKF